MLLNCGRQKKALCALSITLICCWASTKKTHLSFFFYVEKSSPPSSCYTKKSGFFPTRFLGLNCKMIRTNIICAATENLRHKNKWSQNKNKKVSKWNKYKFPVFHWLLFFCLLPSVLWSEDLENDFLNVRRICFCKSVLLCRAFTNPRLCNARFLRVTIGNYTTKPLEP